MNRQFAMKKTTLLVSASLWVCAVVAGIIVMMRFSAGAGSQGLAPGVWPPETEVRQEAKVATLVMLVHPRCSCTSASLDSLAWLMARARGKLAARALFYEPESRSPEWVETATWKNAGKIPGVVRIRDHDAAEAKRFGMVTSGDVQLFDAEGKLIYSGGITPGRGMAGDSEGRRAILAFVEKSETVVARRPVFGCSIVTAK